eukprot:4829268-Amphidinium_carterae.1
MGWPWLPWLVPSKDAPTTRAEALSLLVGQRLAVPPYPVGVHCQIYKGQSAVPCGADVVANPLH